MEKCLIVAVSDNGAIGVAGDMPWHIGEDLKYFKKVTMGCPVIMGRKTYESIGRPLPGRDNIVITGRPEAFDGLPVRCAASLSEAFDAAAGAGRVFVIGGARVYADAVDIVDRMYITRVHTVVADADAFFPEPDPGRWKEEFRSETMTDEESGISFEFTVYSRL